MERFARRLIHPSILLDRALRLMRRMGQVACIGTRSPRVIAKNCEREAGARREQQVALDALQALAAWVEVSALESPGRWIRPEIADGSGRGRRPASKASFEMNFGDGGIIPGEFFGPPIED